MCDFALAALCCAAPHICAVITLMLSEQAQLSAQSYSASANERACRIFQAHHCHGKIHLAAMDLFLFCLCSQPKEVHIDWKMCTRNVTLSLRMYRLLQWGGEAWLRIYHHFKSKNYRFPSPSLPLYVVFCHRQAEWWISVCVTDACSCHMDPPPLCIPYRSQLTMTNSMCH